MLRAQRLCHCNDLVVRAPNTGMLHDELYTTSTPAHSSCSRMSMGVHGC